jgi:hypothetical protein
LPRLKAGGGLQDNRNPPQALEIVMAIPCCEDFTIAGALRRGLSALSQAEVLSEYVTKPKGRTPMTFSDGKRLNLTGTTRRAASFRVKGVSKPTGWPLVSQEWIDYTRLKGAANSYHRRFGPFLVSEEPEWAHTGGPYNLDGSVNQVFWDALRAQTYANPNAVFEDVILDSWGFKYSQNGGTYVAMSQEAIAAFGHTWHPEHERHMRVWFENLGCMGNIGLLALDNEGELVRNYNPEFYRTMLRRARALEQELGCGFVRMFGSSVHEIFNEVDYTITHNRAPLLGPIGGKGWTINNEHNPAFEPEQEAAYFAQARNLNLAWALWRADQTQAEYDETLGRVKAIVQGDGATGCFAPPAEDPNWGAFTQGGSSSRTPIIREAQSEIGSMCREPKDHSHGDAANDALAARMRIKGECASRLVDSTTVWDPEIGKWAEFHASSPYDTGCWSNNNAHYPKGLWVYNGSPPTPPGSSCGSPQPPTVMEWSVKEHTKGPNKTVVDSTPLVGPASYCAAIGFTDGRSRCPVRQEGAADREACEVHAVGTPFWSGNGSVSPDNVYQFWVPRGTSTVATVCSSKTPSVCGSVQVTP